ncbi:hypothetical protein K435DRAFT_646114 [Dendrothele bispora CBS 962.96]|uniref:BZIP domain-containing protein n=1 Tax=Dendrothele bispora (strain CBS 962.96) TaxID=1314807 RepID=A0A4S8MSC9_DENBC|nr:hypothetical protein K435DRAFT_646114 [Dendrothele bispora CBS 962.96]
MISHQNALESFDSPASPLLTDNIQAELDRWQKLVFFSDMGDRRTPSFPSRNTGSNEQPSSSSRSIQNQNNPINSTDVSDALLLAQFAATSGSPQRPPQRPDEFYATMLSLLQSQSQSSGAPPTFPFGSPQSLFQTPSHTHTQAGLPPTWSQFQNLQPQFPPGPNISPHSQSPMMSLPQSSAMNTARSAPSQSPVVASSSSTSVLPSSPTAGDPNDPVEMDEAAVAEDKRRRNTLASARFRIKKKQRNLNLERTVSDLSGRAEELEREVADLRRENGWLKEIVMLKGSRLAGLDVSPHTLRTQVETSGASGSRTIAVEAAGSSSQQEDKSDSEESDSGSDYQPERSRKKDMKTKDKGKGKK